MRALRLAAMILCTMASITVHAFDLQGHRGARGLAPENTLAAFERALAIGVTTLEMDAAVTADGVVVVSHDPALNPAITRDANGRWLAVRGAPIHTLTLAEVQGYDVGRIDPANAYARQFPDQVARDGERIPTLAAVFAKVKVLGADKVRFDIETKIDPTRPDETLAPEPFVKALLAAIADAGVTDRVMIQSFDWRTLAIVQRLAPGMPTVYLTARGTRFDTLTDGTWTGGRLLADYPSVAHMVKAAGGTIWSPQYGAITERDVTGAHALGLQVIPWTVNDASDAERLIGWGVDGLISDRPDRMREAMQRRGIALPAPVPVH
ncbi:MAG: glycerophosphodiester phosphodiesterase [Burkholderiales bacterium]